MLPSEYSVHPGLNLVVQSRYGVPLARFSSASSFSERCWYPGWAPKLLVSLLIKTLNENTHTENNEPAADSNWMNAVCVWTPRMQVKNIKLNFCCWFYVSCVKCLYKEFIDRKQCKFYKSELLHCIQDDRNQRRSGISTNKLSFSYVFEQMYFFLMPSLNMFCCTSILLFYLTAFQCRLERGLEPVSSCHCAKGWVYLDRSQVKHIVTETTNRSHTNLMIM